MSSLELHFSSTFLILSSICIASLCTSLRVPYLPVLQVFHDALIFSFFLFPSFVLCVPFPAGICQIEIDHFFVGNLWSFVDGIGGIEITAWANLCDSG